MEDIMSESQIYDSILSINYRNHLSPNVSRFTLDVNIYSQKTP